ncbi:UDP-glucose 4-epimerase GalE [Nocardiopsis sp. TNDT3]|uniref:UDP-glucose 4-epimerase GalE n=1 Tax=Nocardiopsis sp. TNDT3 TaxID=2249354 RepID=UPI000E3C298D|nr:UDP-glucose 4-epimerase GalE [Nocardiopsis sp. TNDT3]
MKVLLTGGAGYIGSHTAVDLLQRGHDVVIVDDLSNSHPEAVRRVARITGRQVPFHRVDCTYLEEMRRVFTQHRIDAVIHFAAYKAVGESVARPLRYYTNNLDALLTVCRVMEEHQVRRMVFSSSATVYGDPQWMPLTEDHPLSATNPYGATKLFGERILTDLVGACPDWHVSLLRYFNPIGAHESGLIGEDPEGIPNNLFPYIAKVAAGKLERLSVFGDDYATCDGTGVRDYLHVSDLASGHSAAVERLWDRPGVRAYNLGTGRGTSVLEAIAAFEEASGRPVPHVVAPRRPGDIATCYADPSLAWKELGWKATRTVERACSDAWAWQCANPDGYRG